MLITFDPTVMTSKVYFWAYGVDYSFRKYDVYDDESRKYDINLIRRNPAAKKSNTHT